MKLSLVAVLFLVSFAPIIAQSINDPFIVEIVNFQTGVLACYGTLIGNRQVLTAASCVSQLASQIFIRRNGVTSSVFRIFVHPRFRTERQQAFNAAIIEVSIKKG
jgi:V8-like Glu-specific endopeptidase